MIYKRPNKVIEVTKNNMAWREQLPLIKWYKENKNNFLINDKNNKINVFFTEIFEQYLSYKWIIPTDKVLELGARYGTVSCTINSILENKRHHVAVEPDKSVHKTLKKNKKKFNAKFKICKKALSNTPLEFVIDDNDIHGNYTKETTKNKSNVETITHENFFKKYDIKFNILIADCEGCLCKFFEENETFLNQLELILLEQDRECGYESLYNKFSQHGFTKVESILNDYQQVWTKEPTGLD